MSDSNKTLLTSLAYNDINIMLDGEADSRKRFNEFTKQYDIKPNLIYTDPYTLSRYFEDKPNMIDYNLIYTFNSLDFIAKDAWFVYNNREVSNCCDNYYKNILNTYHKLTKLSEGIEDYWMNAFDDKYITHRTISVLITCG